MVGPSAKCAFAVSHFAKPLRTRVGRVLDSSWLLAFDASERKAATKTGFGFLSFRILFATGTTLSRSDLVNLGCSFRFRAKSELFGVVRP